MRGLEEAQVYMGKNGIDAWLVCDFRGNNPVMWQLLASRRQTTRRLFLIIPAQGSPQLFAQAVEKEALAGAGVELVGYSGWREMEGLLKEDLAGKRVAMEYSPRGELPILSWVDGGTLELVRALGAEVISSADLYQAALTRWSPAALESHLRACGEVVEVKELAFDFIREGLGSGRKVDEWDVQRFIVGRFEERGMDYDHPAIVGVEEHSGDPHYAPREGEAREVRPGDWVLIDLWARYPGEEKVFADITWVGFAGRKIPQQHRQAFDAVRRARDRVVARLEESWKRGKSLKGWELDRAARDSIAADGYGKFFIHRTGHSLGPGPSVHGLGANLDDLETHDTRAILPGTGFTIEPGIYLPEFGVRLEIDVYVDPEKGPVVTTPLQEEAIRLV